LGYNPEAMRNARYSVSGLVGVLCARAEVFTLLGRGPEALADLDRAREIFQRFGAKGWLCRLEGIP
jgi:hypothetical protein